MLACCSVCVISSLREKNCCPCTTEQTEEASFCPSSGGSLGLILYVGQWRSFLSYSAWPWVAALKFSKWDDFIEFTKSIKIPWRCKSSNLTLKSKFPNRTPSCKIYLLSSSHLWDARPSRRGFYTLQLLLWRNTTEQQDFILFFL